MSKRYTVTAALPYANGAIHIGHLAGVYIPADIYVRYLRLQKKEVIYICGSDEHGAAISIKAKKENKTPKQIIDKYHKMIKESLIEFGITFDNYSRTSKEIHRETAQEFFIDLYKKNILEEKETEQLYDEEANQFLADRFVIGTCPFCENEEAYGDQCEKCGNTLSTTDLKNPKSIISGSTPVVKKTKHWFLPLNNYQDFIEDWILKTHQKDWKPNVYGQVKSWLTLKLKPRAVTRDLNWGIKVPLETAKGKVLYVWFDAPIGYISATKEWAQKNNVDWKPFWQDEETTLVHFIGKDNIVFHCIIFPCILKAKGNYILPKNVPANEFLNLENKKLSTSKNWAVWLHEYLQDFPNQQDVLRYTLISNAPETKDSNFTWADLQVKNNNELVAILGNFINRVVVLIHKYYNGEVPSIGNPDKIDTATMEHSKNLIRKVEDQIESFHYRGALQSAMDIARLGNKYLADQEPWKLIKTTPERVSTIMNTSIQIVAKLSIVLSPFLPFTAEKIQTILNIKSLDWKTAKDTFSIIEEKHLINKPTLLFQRIEDEVIQEQLDKLKQ